MNADNLFFSLGYQKQEYKDRYINYKKNYGEYNGRIEFDLETQLINCYVEFLDKDLTISYNHVSFCLNAPKVEAIYLKAKELGWCIK